MKEHYHKYVLREKNAIMSILFQSRNKFRNISVMTIIAGINGHLGREPP
jgi:hypothetical protein